MTDHAIAELEARLLALLKGEHSSLTLSYNEHSSGYATAEQELDGGDAYLSSIDWVSDEEKSAAIARNSVWILHWYPNSPVGFNAVGASSLAAIFDYLERQNDD
ncbi:hypothetical protein ACUSIJ_24650 [Pseudochelatococcus sp. B33]